MQEEYERGYFDEAGNSVERASLILQCIYPCALLRPLLDAQEERERGYFDEAGNYVEKEDKDEAELAQDAWLQSDEGVCRCACSETHSVALWLAQAAWLQLGKHTLCTFIHAAAALGSVIVPARFFAALSPTAPLLHCCLHLKPCPLSPQTSAAKVVSDEVRRKIEERQRREAAAEAAGPLSATQIARLQYTASQLLQPGESVAAGLKRLGGHSRRPAKRSKGRGGDVAGMAADVAPDPAAKEQVGGMGGWLIGWLDVFFCA